jgi:hypothetical protein
MDTLSDEEIDSLANGGDQAPAAAEPRTPSSDHPDELSDEEMAHLEAKQPADDKDMGWGEYLGRGATGAVPYVAGAGGAALGTGLGLPGQIGGGALGYAGGKEAEQLLNHYLFGDENKPKSNMDKLKEVAGNTGEGALQEMGGMGVGKAMEKAAPYLGSMAEKFAVKHLRPTPQVARALGPDRLKDIGREALDSGAIQPFGRAEGTAARLSDRMDESGSLINDLVNDSKGEVNPVDIANRFENEVIGPLRKTSGNEALISRLEGQKQSFLEKYAPGHVPGGRDPSLPTTVTRKQQFVPQEPTTDFSKGMMQVGEKRTPRTHVEMVERTVPNKNAGITPGTEQEMRLFHDGEDVKPVMGYQTPEPSGPFSPMKKTVENRIEANPAPKKMSAAQVEAQKRVEDDRVNWLADPKLNSKAQMGWAGVLRDEGEKAVDNEAFPAAKRAYGNQALAKSMAERTSALTDGGTGLFGHMADLGVNLEALKLLANGNPAGVAMSTARMLTKGRTSSTLAKGFDTAAKTLNADTAQRMGSLVSKPVWHRMLQKEKQP